MTDRAFGAISSAVSAGKTKFAFADPKQIIFETGSWMREHPYKTLSYSTLAALISTPGPLVLPILNLVGYGSGGVVAGMFVLYKSCQPNAMHKVYYHSFSRNGSLRLPCL